MRIAHISDLHVLAMNALRPSDMFTKRLTGYANLKLKRSRHHTQARLDRVAEGVRALKPDHLVVTGDLTNLALEEEFRRVRVYLDSLGLVPEAITVVPGNHDAYTRGAYKSGLFSKYFAPLTTATAGRAPPEHQILRTFPFMTWVADTTYVLALCSAVPRLPLVAAGEIGAVQLAGVQTLLAKPWMKGANLIVAVHHPLHMPQKGSKRWFESLRDADALLDVLKAHGHFTLLHGHLHKRMTHRTEAYTSYGAASASNEHQDPLKDAAINVYDIAKDGSIDAWAHTWDEHGASKRDSLAYPSHW